MALPGSGGEEDARVNVVVGAVLDEASFQAEIEKAKTIFKKFADSLGMTFEELAPQAGKINFFQGIDPKAVQAALKQLASDFGPAIAAAEAYRLKIDQIRKELQDISKTQNISLKDAAEGLKATSYAGDKASVGAALQEEMNARRIMVQQIAAQSSQSAALEIANTREVAAAKKAARDQDINEIKLVKQEIINLANQEKISVQDAMQRPQITDNFRSAVVTAGVTELSQKMDITKASTGNLTSAFSALGKAGQYIFGTILGIGAAQALRQLVQLLQESYTAALEFSKALFQLEVGVRALQRQGLDISLASVSKEISNLQAKFPQFTTVQLVEGFAQATLSARELGLSTKDLNRFIESSTILAQITGRDVSDVMRTFALTLSSGYSEGLQKMYININRNVIAQKGLELGFKGGYNAMTQQERALAALDVVYSQTAKLSQDASKFQETYAGKQAIANAQWEQTKVIVGSELLVSLAPMLELLSRIVLVLVKTGDAFWKLTNIIKTIPIRGFLYMIGDGIALLSQFWGVLSGKGFDMSGFQAQMENIRVTIDKELNRAIGLGKGLKDVPIGEKGTQPLTTETDNQVKAEEDAQKKLGDIIDSGINDRIDAEEKYKSDLEKIDIDYNRAIEDEELNHQQKLDSITIDYQRKRDNARLDYQRNLAQDGQDQANKLEDLNNKHRQDELEAERKFQEKMRKLQEDFLLSMEEAIRGNDIKTAASLVRKYQLDKAQNTREYNLDNLNRDEGYQSDLAKLQRDNQDKRAERLRDFNQKMQDIAQQEAYAKVDEQKRHAQELVDLKKQDDEKRADRLKNYQRDLQDLQKSYNDKLRALANSIIQENNLSMQGANAVYQNLLKYYGPNGAILKLYQYMVQAIQNSAKAVADTPLPTLGGTASGSAGKAFANGGSFIANTPTTALFGEAGPELVNIVPLKGTSNIQKLLPSANTAIGAWNTNNGKISMRVSLTPGLVGEIIEASLDQFAEVLVRSER